MVKYYDWVGHASQNLLNTFLNVSTTRCKSQMEKCIGLTGEYKWGGADTFLNVLLNKIKDTNVKCQGPEPHTDLLLQLL